MITVLAFVLVSVMSGDTIQDFMKVVENDDDSIRYFWVLTDYHLDYNYTTGGEPYCVTKDFCCRQERGLFKAGEFATPLSPRCDIPVRTFEGSLEFVRDYPLDSSKVLGVIAAGDSAAHDKSTQTQELNVDHVVKVYELFDEYLTKTKGFKVFPTLGNHDSYPLDELDFRPGGAYLLDILPKIWKPWLDEGSLSQVDEFGFYTQSISDNENTTKLSIISLNTFWVDSSNKYMKNYPNSTHFLADWLRSQLQEVKGRGERAIIIGHFSPGALGPYFSFVDKTDWHVTDEWNEDFISISEDFEDTIVAQISGHEHIDRFITIQSKNKNEKPTSVCFVVPAITSLPFSNPSVRLYKYDTKNPQYFKDMITFINIVKDSNDQGTMKGSWKIEYSFTDSYNVSDLSPQSVQSVINNLEDDKHLYKEKYMHYHFSEYFNDVCNLECKKKMLCSMQYITKDTYDECVKK